MTAPFENPRPVADFWRDGQAVPQGRITLPDWWDELAVQAWLDGSSSGRPLPDSAGTQAIETSGPIAPSAIRELFESFDTRPAPPWAVKPVRWDDLVDLYAQFDPTPLPKVIVADERTWNALRRVVPVVPADRVIPLGAPFTGTLGSLLGVPVVVHREPRRARLARRTGPLVGRRARHAGALRVARLQRRVDRRAARRAPQPARGVFGVFR